VYQAWRKWGVFCDQAAQSNSPLGGWEVMPCGQMMKQLIVIALGNSVPKTGKGTSTV
jgi:hypothetical protein